MLRVIDPGFMTSVQDLGRPGVERFGVPVSGAMDRFALMAANQLVGNPWDAAGLESLWQGPVLRAESDCLLAAAGAGFELRVDGRSLPLWMSVYVRAGSTVQLLGREDAGWGCLAAAGGVDVPPLMGSRATYLRGGFGGFQGRLLQPGDALPIGRLHAAPAAWPEWAGRWLPPDCRPDYDAAPLIGVVPGPQDAAFGPEGWEAFLGGEYRAAVDSDRMGYRLDGPAVPHAAPADILSEGVALGAVQIPGDGRPIVMLADRQTTGGYTKIATVISADLPRLVQCTPGRGSLRFRVVTVEAAQARWRALVRGLQTGMETE